MTNLAFRRNLSLFWFSRIGSDYWEAVLLASAYIVFRWLPATRAAAVVALASASVALVRAIGLRFASEFRRLEVWISLARYSHFESVAEKFTSPCSETHSMMRALFIVPYMAFYLPHGLIDISRSAISKRFNPRSPPRDTAQYLYSRIKKSLLESRQPIEMKNNERPVWRGLIPTSVLLIPILFLVAVGLFTCLAWKMWTTGFLPFMAFGIFALCALLVLLSGKHFAVMYIVALEMISSLFKLDFGILRIEIRVLITFVFPLYFFINLKLIQHLILNTFQRLREDLGPDHYLSKLTHIYHAIPTNEQEVAMKICDTATNKHAHIAHRRADKFVVSVHGGESNELRCTLFDFNEERMDLDDVEGNGGIPPNLTGATWCGQRGTAYSDDQV